MNLHYLKNTITKENFMDYNKFSNHYLGLEDMIPSLSDTMLLTFHQSFNLLSIAIKNKNLKEIHLFSHSLKGTLSNFFFAYFTNNLEKIEYLSSESSNLPNIELILKELNENKETLILALNFLSKRINE